MLDTIWRILIATSFSASLTYAISLPASPRISTDSAPRTALYVSTTGSDSNPGTQDLPFKTILAASQAARAGTIVHVAPGAYNGGFTTTTSGTASSPIHYVSDTKWGAKIVPATTSTYDMAWDNRGAYVVIDGFEVDGTNYHSGTRWRLGIYSTGSYSVIENNNVHNIAWNVACSGQGGAGIEGDSYYGGIEIDLIGNIVHDIGPRSCIYIQGAYQTASGKVMNNLVYRVSGWGIHLWHDANHVTIANNTIFNSANGGVLVGGGNYVTGRGPADYVTVANNIVFDNGRYGLVEAGQTGSHNLFTHNLSFQNGTNWRLRTSAPDSAAVTADPKFVNYIRTGGGDYHLAAGSPAIAAGAASYATKDLDGLPRPQGAGYAIGAYEFVSLQTRAQ
jgi:hypothetical protein